MFGDLSFSHILILLLIVVLVFGAKRIPEIGSSLGQGIREFRRSLTRRGESPESEVVALIPAQTSAGSSSPGTPGG